MNVIRITDYTNRQTIKTLRRLLELAAKGQITGVAMCLKYKDGAEDSVFAGEYEVNKAEAVNAAMRLSWKLTQAQDSGTGPP